VTVVVAARLLMMGPTPSHAFPVIASRLDFSRARADMHARMRSVEAWGFTLGIPGVCLVLVAIISAPSTASTASQHRASSCRLGGVLPMFLDYSVTHVPGLYRDGG
jgi:hypothetical protein